MTDEKAVAVLSGGMDSTAMLYQLVTLKDYKPENVLAVSFLYGQKHAKELEYARKTTIKLGVQHTLVPMKFLAELLPSALTTADHDVPDGHYAEDSMAQTVVPNRNMIMISIATGLAVAHGARTVHLGVHAGDHFVYPDCRPDFIWQVSRAAYLGTLGFAPEDFQIVAPFMNIPKDGIVEIGHECKVPWEDTWSCYKGGEYHCGTCGTCVERKEAFMLARIEDPTIYVDDTGAFTEDSIQPQHDEEIADLEAIENDSELGGDGGVPEEIKLLANRVPVQDTQPQEG
jgi:7-cyano-7-deazaguanine synthase